MYLLTTQHNSLAFEIFQWFLVCLSSICVDLIRSSRLCIRRTTYVEHDNIVRNVVRSITHERIISCTELTVAKIFHDLKQHR